MPQVSEALETTRSSRDEFGSPDCTILAITSIIVDNAEHGLGLAMLGHATSYKSEVPLHRHKRNRLKLPGIPGGNAIRIYVMRNNGRRSACKLAEAVYFEIELIERAGVLQVPERAGQEHLGATGNTDAAVCPGANGKDVRA
jgi:hypothetical protein